MRRARRFLRLPPRDRRLLAEAAALVVLARLGLWLLPFRSVRGLLARVPARATDARDDNTITGRIAWAVPVVSACVPAATCLTQALAAQALLARRGCPAELRIGVARGANGMLEAHAWVERDDRVVIGDRADLSRYSILQILREELV